MNTEQNTSALWWVGQFVSLACGAWIGIEHGSAEGLTVAYALLVLVDIREAMTSNAELNDLTHRDDNK